MAHLDRKQAYEYNKKYRAKYPEKHREWKRASAAKNRKTRIAYDLSHKNEINAAREAYKLTTKGYFLSKLSSLKIRIRQTGLAPTDLSVPQLVALHERQKGKCDLTGRVLCLKRTRSIDSLSIDRKNSKKGYTIKNVRLVTWQANSARHTGTDRDLIAFCKDVLKHTISRR